MNRFIVADPDLCIGCNTCMAGCSTVHEAQGLQSYPRLILESIGQVTAPLSCRHCEDAYCEKVCPVHAIHYGKDQIDLDESKCIGCKLCSIACPFGAITMSGSILPVHNPQTVYVSEEMEVSGMPWIHKEHSVAVKCDLCNFQADKGPECIRVCPSKAIKLIDDKVLSEQTDKRRKAAIKALGLGVDFHQKDELVPH